MGAAPAVGIPPKGRTQTNRRIVCISAPLAIRLRVGSALILAM